MPDPCRSAYVVLAGLLLVLLGGVRPGVLAQEPPDSVQTRSAEVEPARLDSLPTREFDDPVGPPSWTPPADTGDGDRVYVNADSLSAIRANGERIQELFGNVFVRHDTTQLRSAYAKRFLNRDELLFIDNVVIYERGDTLRADTVRYDRESEIGHARGNVRLTDGEVTVRADRGIYYAEEKRSVFPDSVVLVDSSRVLRAAYGTYWSNERRAEFGGGVQMTEPETRIHADSLTFYRDRDRSIAVGNVFIDRRGGEDAEEDTTSRTYLFGNRADNREQRRYSRVDGNALLIQVRADSTGAPTDTLAVAAHRLEAFRTDTHRRLVAVDSVRIWQPSLAAVADSVVYDRVIGVRADTSRDSVPIDTTRPPRDSIGAVVAAVPSDSATGKRAAGVDTTARERVSERAAPSDSSAILTDADSVAASEAVADPAGRSTGREGAQQRGRKWTTPVARAEEQLPLEEIRLFRQPMTWFEGSQVWGDSIRVRAQNRQPDTVFVRGAAFAARRDSVLERIQQLKAQNLTAFFRRDSLRRIRAQPNARAIRFLAAKNDSLNGAAKTSGDRILLRFNEGTVRRISVVGGVETTYYRKNQNIPDPFHLDGFRWVPEREPTRSRLLRDDRVDRWLEQPVPSPDSQRVRPVARRAARGRPDSSMHEPVPRDTSSAGTPSRESSRETPPDSSGTGASVPPDSIPAPPARPVSPDTSKQTTNETP